jgi:hypothetical protein
MTGSFGRRQKGSGALSISGPLNFIPDLLLSPRAVIESKSATLASPTLFVPLPITVLRFLRFNGGLRTLHFEY